MLNTAPADGFHINTVFSSIFLLFGLIPAIYAALIIPSGRSKNKVGLGKGDPPLASVCLDSGVAVSDRHGGSGKLGLLTLRRSLATRSIRQGAAHETRPRLSAHIPNLLF